MIDSAAAWGSARTILLPLQGEVPFSQEQVSKGLHSTDWWEGEEVTACGLHAAWLMLSLSLQGPNYGCVTQEEVLSKILQILLRPVRGHPWTWLIVASHVHNRKAFGQSLIDKALFKPMRICFIQNILQFTFFQVLNGSGPATSLCETFLYHIFWWLKFWGTNFCFLGAQFCEVGDVGKSILLQLCSVGCESQRREKIGCLTGTWMGREFVWNSWMIYSYSYILYLYIYIYSWLVWYEHSNVQWLQLTCKRTNVPKFGLSDQ